jgi:lysozyme
MDISQSGINLTAQFEGLAQVNPNDGLVYPYADPVGLPTIGYGNRTDLNGNRVTMNTSPITQDQALQLLQTVLEQFASSVNNMVTVSLSQNQFDALVDFAYNAGAANLQSSTLLRLLNSGDYAGAGGQFIRWNKATSNGQLIVLPGLTRRRAAEAQLFNTPDA